MVSKSNLAVTVSCPVFGWRMKILSSFPFVILYVRTSESTSVAVTVNTDCPIAAVSDILVKYSENSKIGLTSSMLPIVTRTVVVPVRGCAPLSIASIVSSYLVSVS